MALLKETPLIESIHEMWVDTKHGADNEEGSGEVYDVEHEGVEDDGYFSEEDGDDGEEEPGGEEGEAVVVVEIFAEDEFVGLLNKVHLSLVMMFNNNNELMMVI